MATFGGGAAPKENCWNCGRWAWVGHASHERENGVIVNIFRCVNCGANVSDAFNPSENYSPESNTLQPFIIYGIYEGGKREVSLGAWSGTSGEDAMHRADYWHNHVDHNDPSSPHVTVTRYKLTGLT